MVLASKQSRGREKSTQNLSGLRLCRSVVEWEAVAVTTHEPIPQLKSTIAKVCNCFPRGPSFGSLHKQRLPDELKECPAKKVLINGLVYSYRRYIISHCFIEYNFFACTFFFADTDHVIILRRFGPLFCSSKKECMQTYSCLHALFLMNKTKDQTS